MSFLTELKKQRGEEYYILEKRNSILTFAPSNSTNYAEIVYYKEPFSIPVEVGNMDMEKRKRTFIKDEDGYNVAQKTVILRKIDNTLNKCGKRAVKNIVLYAMANIWEMFITLTFDSSVLNRYDEIECKEKWREFQYYSVRKFPNCKLLAVWEYHKKTDEYGARALHFHVLASGLPIETIPWINNDGTQRVSKSGAPLFILSPKAWPFGFSTVAYLPKDGADNARVANYLTKYVSKTRSRRGDKIKMSEEVGNYGAKRYYHTRSLKVCDQFVLDELMTLDQIGEFAQVNNLSLHKENDRMVVFRRYAIESENFTPLVEVIESDAEVSTNNNIEFVVNYEHTAPPNKLPNLRLIVDAAELEELNSIF